MLPTPARWSARLEALREQFNALDAGVATIDEAALLRSWHRCSQAGQRGRSEVRLRQAEGGLQLGPRECEVVCRVTNLLAASVDAAGAVVIATDVAGAVVHAAGRDESLPACWRGLMRPGTSMAESAVGTSAPTLAAIERRPQTVIRDAHYRRSMEAFYCTAVPLSHPAGGLLGALDISGYESLPRIDALGLLGLAADRIEDELVCGHASAGVMQLLPPVAMGAAMRPALVAVNDEGEATALNSIARRWFRVPATLRLPQPLSRLVGSAAGHIERAPHRHTTHVVELQMPSGWVLLMRYGPPGPVEQHGAIDRPERAAGAHVQSTGMAGPAPPAPSLAQARVDAVHHALAACGGNVSRAARRLGVSRNSIYRWLGSEQPADHS